MIKENMQELKEYTQEIKKHLEHYEKDNCKTDVYKELLEQYNILNNLLEELVKLQKENQEQKNTIAVLHYVIDNNYVSAEKIKKQIKEVIKNNKTDLKFNEYEENKTQSDLDELMKIADAICID